MTGNLIPVEKCHFDSKSSLSGMLKPERTLNYFENCIFVE